MDFKRILTIQDISCVGQCSLTVALPILSACGLETAVLPSAVLSTHTGGFSGYTFRDLTDDMPAISAHWQKEGLKFDAVYTGYLGSTKQIQYVCDIIDANIKPGALKIVDPAMADNGKLYYGFNDEFVNGMKSLCAKADYLLPNITESCFLTGVPYREEYDRSYVTRLCEKLCAMGAKTIVLTGVSYRKGYTGVVVYSAGDMKYYEHAKIAHGCHGTGDIYASAFAGAMLNGHEALESARIAADYVVRCIQTTQLDPDHWYGARFEPVVDELIKAVKG